MSNFYGKNFQNFYLQKNYYGHIFLMPPENYIEFLKRVYSRFRNANGPKNLYELKKMALDEARKVSSTLNIKSHTKKSKGERELMSKDDLLKLLQAVYNIIDPLLIKVNQNYKNERRKNYDDNDKYLEIIKTFEQQKVNLLTFTLKSVCKFMKLKYTVLQETVFHFIEKNEASVTEMVNSFTKMGKVLALAPKKLSTDDIVDILKIYYENLNYMVVNSESGKNEYSKYALIFINDLIYENYGLEEEQVFAFIEEKKLIQHKEINKTLGLIKAIINDNISVLFDI